MNKNTLLAILAGAALSANLFAQGPGRPGGPGGPTATQQGRNMPNQNRQPASQSVYMQILARSDVQADLQITTAQRTQLAKIAQQPGVDEGVLGQVGKVLSAEQMKRLKELYVQYLGYGSLASSDIQNALNLTADQKARIQTILDAQRQYAANIERQGLNPTARQQTSAQLQQLHARANAELAKVLTPSQDKALKAMAGKALSSGRTQGGGDIE